MSTTTTATPATSTRRRTQHTTPKALEEEDAGEELASQPLIYSTYEMTSSLYQRPWDR